MAKAEDLPHIDVGIKLVWPTVDEEGGPHTLVETIVERAAAQLANDRDLDARGKYISRVSAIRDEEIRKQVQPIIADALEHPIQRTNTFGDPIGEPTSLRDLIMETARKEWNRTENSTHTRSRETFIQKVVREQVEQVFAKELREVIAAAKTDVLEAVRAQAADVLTETIQRSAKGL